VATGIHRSYFSTDAASFATGTLTNTSNVAITVTYTVTKSGTCTGSSFTASVRVNQNHRSGPNSGSSMQPWSVTLRAADFLEQNHPYRYNLWLAASGSDRYHRSCFGYRCGFVCDRNINQYKQCSDHGNLPLPDRVHASDHRSVVLW
jgi:hypothetical protein